MRKWLVTTAVLALAMTPLRADVTIVQTMTLEGAAAAMMGAQLPTMTTRIKGLKSRSDIEIMGQTITAITDLAENRVIVLQPQTRTAHVITPESLPASGPSAGASAVAVTMKPTGQSQVIDGIRCEEHTLSLTLSMAELGGQLPPEAAAMMKDVTMAMDGSFWVARTAPGAPEFVAFGRAAAKAGLLSAVSGMPPGQGGLDKLTAATASAPGIPYMAEIMMTFQGSGPLVEAMKQMGATKIIQKTSSVSTETISDDLFKVPEGYTIEK